MPKKDLVIGSLVADDFYFFFEEEGIEQLEKFKKLVGTFVCYDNKPPGDLLKMELNVCVFKPTKDHISLLLSDQPGFKIGISIGFPNKAVYFYITEDEFEDWFIEADDWIRDHGPDLRDGSYNVYIRRGSSKNSLTKKSDIMNLIKQAE